ncbi:MAG TPA: flagellar assembly protein FliX [Caulobacteraceae bacterium]|jgi:hypothetical protein
MKVTGPTGPSSTAGASSIGASSRPAAAPGFSPVSAPAEPQTAMSAGGVGQIGSLEALIALQDVGGPLERRRRALGRAGAILNALEGLKLDLLEGRLSPGAIQSLTNAVRDQRADTDDPRLESVLDEIETRAAVELAKLEAPATAA